VRCGITSDPASRWIARTRSCRSSGRAPGVVVSRRRRAPLPDSRIVHAASISRRRSRRAAVEAAPRRRTHVANSVRAPSAPRRTHRAATDSRPRAGEAVPCGPVLVDGLTDRRDLRGVVPQHPRSGARRERRALAVKSPKYSGVACGNEIAHGHRRQADVREGRKYGAVPGHLRERCERGRRAAPWFARMPRRRARAGVRPRRAAVTPAIVTASLSSSAARRSGARRPTSPRDRLRQLVQVVERLQHETSAPRPSRISRLLKTNSAPSGPTGPIDRR